MAKTKPAVKTSVKKQKRARKQFEVDKAALTAAAVGTFLLATEVSAAEDTKLTAEQLKDQNLQEQNLLQAQAEQSADLDPAALALDELALQDLALEDLALEDLPELTELGAELPLDEEAFPEFASDGSEDSLDGTQLSQASPSVTTAPGVDGKTVMSDAGSAGGGAGEAGAASSTAGSAAEAGAAAGAGGAAGAGLPGIAAFSSIPAGLVAGGLGLVAVAGAAGGGSGGSGGLASGGTTSVAKGLVVDGNVSGATIFYDANANGKLDAGEVSSKTGADGSYTLSGYTATGNGQIVVLAGGVDVLTGQTVGMMITPHGYTNVSPLTTLLAASPGVTEAQLKAKLGLDPSIDLNNYDPLKDMQSDDPDVRAAAEKAFTVSQQVYAVLQTAATLQANGGAVDADDITNIAQALTKGIMDSTGGNTLSVIQEATQAAVTAATNGNQALADSVAAALNNVNSAIQTSYTGLANTLKTGTDADKAAAVSVAAVSQSALVNAVSSGDTSTLGVLSSQDGLQKLADLYEDGIKDNLANGGTGSVSVSAPVTLTIAQATATPPTGPYTIVDSADNIEDYLAGPSTTLFTGAIGVVATSITPITLAQASDLIADFSNISFQNKTLAAAGPLAMTMAEVAPLIGHHLKFDASDTHIVLQFNDGELSSVIDSALNLGVLGVDVLQPLSGELTLTAAQATAAVITGHMKFDDAADVTVNVTQDELNSVLTTPGAVEALGHAGIDELGAVGGSISLTTLQAENLVHAGLEFADSADITLGLTTSSSHTFLNTSLKDLQQLGVDHVGLEGGVGEIRLELGDNTWVSGALPQFAESYNVDLQFNDNQLQEIIDHKADLVAANFDELNATDTTVTLTVAQADALLGGDGSFDLGSDLGFEAANAVTLQAAGGDLGGVADQAVALHQMGVDQIDVAGGNVAATITDGQAHDLVSAGLEFVAGDTITVDASGTHMQTSLQKLQQLGVDAVSAAGAAAFTVDIGDINQLNFGALPSFQSDDHVTLSLSASDGGYLFDNPGLFFDLEDAGIDALYIKDEDVVLSMAEAHAVADADLQFSTNNDVTLEVHQAELTEMIPGLSSVQMLGVDHLSGEGSLALNDAAAHALVHAGIDFAEDSNVTMNVDGAGTHLSSTLKDLQNLNVDLVTAVAGTDVVVDLGSGGWNHESLPTFAEGLEVTLNVGAAQLGQVAGHYDQLYGHGIDSVRVHGTGDALDGLNQTQVSDAHVDAFTLDVTAQDLNSLLGDINTNALPQVGSVEVDTIDVVGFSGHASELHVGADLAGAMLGHGLSFEAADHITLDVEVGSGHGTSFATSAETLHNLGIDDVAVHFDNTGPVDLHQLSHFEDSLDVTLDLSELDVANMPALNEISGALLESLGIDNIEVNADIGSLSSQLLGALDNSTDGTLDKIHNVMDLKAHVDLNGNGDLDDAMSSLFNGLTNQDFSGDYGDLINALTESGITEMTVETGTVGVSDSLISALAESGMLHALPDSTINIDASASGHHLYTTLKDMADLDVDSVDTGANAGDVYINLGTLGQNGALAEVKALLDSLDPIVFSGAGTPTLVLDVRTAEALTDSNGVFDSTVMAGLENIGIHDVAVLVGHNENYTVAQTPINSPEVKLIGQDMDPTLFDELHHPHR